MNPCAELAERIDDALPQTQCTRCGYPDCRAYAQAIAEGLAAINQCPPGGQEGIVRLAEIAGKRVEALNPANGREAPLRLARIDEAACIGCALCIDACPVDCIVGARKSMHTVMERFCTGCERCLPVCPMDCITMHETDPVRTGRQAWSAEQAHQARARYAKHQRRLERDREQDTICPAMRPSSPGSQAEVRLAQYGPSADLRRSTIEAALARARARRPT